MRESCERRRESRASRASRERSKHERASPRSRDLARCRIEVGHDPLPSHPTISSSYRGRAYVVAPIPARCEPAMSPCLGARSSRCTKAKNSLKRCRPDAASPMADRDLSHILALVRPLSRHTTISPSARSPVLARGLAPVVGRARLISRGSWRGACAAWRARPARRAAPRGARTWR